MTKTIGRLILAALAATNAATLLFFAYRYVWFSVEVVPSDRLFFILVMCVWTIPAFILVEYEIANK